MPITFGLYGWAAGWMAYGPGVNLMFAGSGFALGTLIACQKSDEHYRRQEGRVYWLPSISDEEKRQALYVFLDL